MTDADFESAAAALERYRNFEECLLHEARLTRGGLEFELDFGVIWRSADRSDRRVLDPPRRVVICLQVVTVVDMRFAFPAGALEDPSRADWGLSEVALVRVVRDGPGHRLIVQWEGESRIEATFERLIIREGD